MMRNLILSSALGFLFFASSCTLGHYGKRNFRPIGTQKQNTTFPKPIFGDSFNSFLFKANISIYGKDVSGLLVAKQMEPQDYRIIFTTELGMKLFDFEFKDTSFVLHYCVPQFNRAKLLKTIKEDIEILLMNNLNEKEAEVFNRLEGSCRRGGDYEVYKLKKDKMFDYYFVDSYIFSDGKEHLSKIEHSKKRIKKVVFTMNDYKDDFPTRIIIGHCDIKLKIELNLLKR